MSRPAMDQPTRNEALMIAAGAPMQPEPAHALALAELAGEDEDPLPLTRAELDAQLDAATIDLGRALLRNTLRRKLEQVLEYAESDLAEVLGQLALICDEKRDYYADPWRDEEGYIAVDEDEAVRWGINRDACLAAAKEVL